MMSVLFVIEMFTFGFEERRFCDVGGVSWALDIGRSVYQNLEGVRLFLSALF